MPFYPRSIHLVWACVGILVKNQPSYILALFATSKSPSFYFVLCYTGLIAGALLVLILALLFLSSTPAKIVLLAIFLLSLLLGIIAAAQRNLEVSSVKS